MNGGDEIFVFFFFLFYKVIYCYSILFFVCNIHLSSQKMFESNQRRDDHLDVWMKYCSVFKN